MRHIIVGMSGATGLLYGVALLRQLAETEQVTTHLIMTDWAVKTLALETDESLEKLHDLADHVYDNSDLSAAVASGSFPCDGMVVAPCSMKTLAGVASGFSDNLLLRACDVSLKERRRLILMARETPLSEIHLENMLRATRAGAVILPPCPAFYTRPQSVEDIVAQTAAHAMALLGLDSHKMKRWTLD